MLGDMAKQLHRIYGVDFSGALDAGNKIWVAKGSIRANALRIETCCRARDLPGSGSHRDSCLAALVELVRKEEACVIGLDFPFGLPRNLVEESNWDEFVLSFPDRHPGPDRFRARCRATSRRPELKRLTDRKSKTPFSVYNLRLFKQTYFGIRNVLFPVVSQRLGCVLPMQEPVPDIPWIVEVCPASTLKQWDMKGSYKRRTADHCRMRLRILDKIKSTGLLSIPSADLQSRITDNWQGDALDSVIAAFATFRALRDLASLPNRESANYPTYAVEGYVVV